VLVAAGLAGWLSPVRAQEKTSRALTTVAGTSQTNASAESHHAYVLGTNGTLYLTLPAGWKDNVKRARDAQGLHDAVILTPADTNKFNFMIVVFTISEKHAGSDLLKNSLLQSGERDLTNFAETSLTLRDLEGGQAAGAYFRVTDRRLMATKAAAGDFKYMTRGYAVLGPLVLTFDLLSNDAGRDEPAAIEVLRGARFAPSPPGGT
jgi:hypothetical protein